ncbi:MAG: hypothetical protein HC880_12980, partial [Bacteroidia bacterium]|nr:hypothetical protein [Bacteroidia bacterium]
LYLFTDLRKDFHPDHIAKTAEELLRSIPVYIRIDTFALENAQLDYGLKSKDPESKKAGTSWHRTESINLFARRIELALDKATDPVENSRKLLYSEDIYLLMDNYRYLSPDQRYELRFGRLESSLSDSTVSIRDLHYHPLWERSQFDSLFPYQATRYDIAVEDVKARMADVRRLLNNRGYRLYSLALNNIDLDIYNNAVPPAKPGEPTETPEEMLARLPYAIQIDTFALNNARLQYGRKIKKGSKSGKIFTTPTASILALTR